MKVVYFDKETSEHVTISEVYKIEEIGKGHVLYAEGIKVYWYEDKDHVYKKHAYIPSIYVTGIGIN